MEESYTIYCIGTIGRCHGRYTPHFVHCTLKQSNAVANTVQYSLNPSLIRGATSGLTTGAVYVVVFLMKEQRS